MDTGIMENAHLIAVLLSWTVKLSPYPHPQIPPDIQFIDHSFLVEHACNNNKNCHASAWYDDNGTIYLDEILRGREDAITRSVIVHELVHYLQDLNNQYMSGSCDDHLIRERQAYSIQRQYINKIAGRFAAVYMNFPPCKNG